MGAGFRFEFLESLDLIQFGALMDSVNRHQTLSRVGRVYDLAMGSRGDDKGLKKYVKDLLNSAGFKSPGGTTDDFLKRFGGGI